MRRHNDLDATEPAVNERASVGRFHFGSRETRALATLISAYILVFSIRSALLFDQYAYMAFDLGIFDQAVWLISRGERAFVSLRGMHILGDHFSPIVYLIAPLYWLYPSPKALLFLQTTALAFGALPVYGIALTYTKSRAIGLVFAFAYLAYPAVQWSNTYEFHPDTLATPLLLLAFYCVQARRWNCFALAVLASALTKEIAGLYIACLGMHVFGVDRRRGLATVVFGVAMLFVSFHIVQWFNDNRPSPYVGLYAGYGSSPWQIISTTMTSPLRVIDDINNPGAHQYLFQLLMPLFFLPLLAPEILVLATPGFLSNALSRNPAMASIEEYYAAYMVPFIVVAAIVGFNRLRKSGWFADLALITNMLIWATGGLLWGPLVRPLAGLYSAARPPQAAIQECDQLVGLIHPQSRVAAQMAIAPHLAHRRHIYTFPNPMVRAAWGGSPQDLDEIGCVTGTIIPAALHAAIAARIRDVDEIALCPRSNVFPLSESNYTKTVVALLHNDQFGIVFLGKHTLLLRQGANHEAGLNLLSMRTRIPIRTPDDIDKAYWRWRANQS